MDLGEPLRSIIPSVTGGVLGVLARAHEPLTGREVAKRIKGKPSHTGVQNALNALVKAGVVDRSDKGRSGLFSLNREHLAAAPIEELAGLRQRLIDGLIREIEAWPDTPDSAVLFGSVARGDAGPQSDIDLLLVRPERIDANDVPWRERIANLNAQVTRWTGNPLRVVELSRSEIRQQLADNEPYLVAAERDGIRLVGLRIRQMRERATS